jgi:hypothetical protein
MEFFLKRNMRVVGELYRSAAQISVSVTLILCAPCAVI